MISQKHNKLIVILGQTASGKTDLSIRLAKQFNGQDARRNFAEAKLRLASIEIVSADSRQIYKGLNIGSGKITKRQMQGVPHHLLNVANPKQKFSVAQYQKLALQAIRKIQAKNNIPLLVGGTGFYIQSIVDGIIIPEVKPNWKLRKTLQQKSAMQLYTMLKKLDPGRAKHIDAKNPVRLIRAIEIVKTTKKPIPKLKINNQFEVLQIGIKKSPNELKKLIRKRLLKRIKRIVREVEKLHKNRLSWKRLEELGLEYRFVAQYLLDHITYQDMVDSLEKEIWHFAKRQMTWFKRDKRIHWIKNQKQAEALLKKFL